MTLNSGLEIRAASGLSLSNLVIVTFLCRGKVSQMKGLRHIKQWSARARYGITRRALSALRRIRSVNYLDSYVNSAPGPQNALGHLNAKTHSV